MNSFVFGIAMILTGLAGVIVASPRGRRRRYRRRRRPIALFARRATRWLRILVISVGVTAVVLGVGLTVVSLSGFDILAEM